MKKVTSTCVGTSKDKELDGVQSKLGVFATPKER